MKNWLNGYTGYDPIDNLPMPWRYGLPMIISAIMSLVMVSLITKYQIVFFPAKFVEHMEIVLFAVPYTILFVWLRKSNWLFFYLAILIPLLLVDLWLESNFVRSEDFPALWNYYPDSPFMQIKPIILRYFVTLSADAILMGPIFMWVVRRVASLFVEKKKGECSNLLEDYSPDDKECRPVRDFGFVLIRSIGICFFLYLCLLLIGAFGYNSSSECTSIFFEPFSDLLPLIYSNMFHGVNTFGKIGLLTMLAFAAAFNRPMRYFYVIPLVVGHIAAAGVSWLIFLRDRNAEFAKMSAMVDTVMLILFLVVLFHSRQYVLPHYKRIKDFPKNFALTSRLYDYLLMGLTIIFFTAPTILIFLYLYPSFGFSFFGSKKIYINLLTGSQLIEPLPLLINSITLYTTLGTISAMAVVYKQLRDKLIYYINDPLLICFFSFFIWYTISLFKGIEYSATWHSILWILSLSSLAILLAIQIVRRSHYNTYRNIKSLHPSEADVALTFANGVFARDKEFDYSVPRRIDQYIGSIKSRKRGILNFPFWIIGNIVTPIIGLRPRLSSMSQEESSYFLSRYLIRTEENTRRAFVPLLANLFKQLGLSIKAICSLAFLSSTEGQNYVGYISPESRERFRKKIVATSPDDIGVTPPINEEDINNYRPYEEIEQGKIPSEFLSKKISEKSFNYSESYDYVIVGSGAGGAVMAYRLACREDIDASKILLVERGSRNSHINDMNDDELQMTASLYKEGGLQQTKNFDMIMLQGQALGGTTVINNAVCFEMPESAKEEWRFFGLEETVSALCSADAPFAPDGHYAIIEKEINIHPIDDSAVNQAVVDRFVKGVNATPNVVLDKTHDERGKVKVNAINETGDGLWNLGNNRLRKRSMEATYIPWAEAKGIHTMCDSNVLKYNYEGKEDKKQVKNILVDRHGTLCHIRINKKLIIAGGCLASTHLLMRSDDKFTKKDAKLSCNYAFPVIIKYDEDINAYDGAQITAAAKDQNMDVLYETYFNPPAAFSLTIPFNFTVFRDVLKDYKKHLCFGILIKSDRSGIIDKDTNSLTGRAFSWELTKDEREVIRDSLIRMIEIARNSRAVQMILPLKPGVRLNLQDESTQEFIEKFANCDLQQSEIVLSTAHPQGGNPMADKGHGVFDPVVTPEFKVVSYDNLHIVDGSIFPSSIGVNPQWTIMALSSLASKYV